MDWIIEKAMELGISSIQPLLTTLRCACRQNGQKKLSHWQGIIVAAAEQSGRNRLAHLSAPLDLENGWGNRIYINGSCFRRVPINRWPNGQNIAPTGGQLADRS
jgi:RsmE family RNA methyltransferase